MSRAEAILLPLRRLPQAPPPAASPPAGPQRTIWGLDPVQLHTRYWASMGVQVVRQGEPSEIVRHAELFLLTESPTLTLFKLTDVVDALNWIKPQVMFVRLHDTRERAYREHVVTDESEQFVRFERRYEASSRLTRIALTPDADVAKLWQSAPDTLTGWRRLRRFIRQTERATFSVTGHIYDRTNNREVANFIYDLVARWHRPDSTVLRARLINGKVWRDAQSKVDPAVKFIGPVWVGCGRKVEPNGVPIIGPAVIWDDPNNRPVNDDIHWLHIEPTAIPEDTPRRGRIRCSIASPSAVSICVSQPPACLPHSGSTRSSCWRSTSKTAAPSSSLTKEKPAADENSAA